MGASVVVEAIVLKSYPLKDSDLFYALFSRELGKIKVIAKGVRKAKSKRSPLMQTGNTVKTQLYEGRELYILREVELVQEAFSVTVSSQLVSYMLHVVELLDGLLAEGQVQNDIYELARRVIAQLVYQPRQVYLRYFEVQLLKRLGYLPQLDSLMLDGLGEKQREMLGILEGINFSRLEKLKMVSREHQELAEFLQGFLEQVMERPLKSIAFFAS